jgi:hypothetical protein
MQQQLRVTKATLLIVINWKFTAEIKYQMHCTMNGTLMDELATPKKLKIKKFSSVLLNQFNYIIC